MSKSRKNTRLSRRCLSFKNTDIHADESTDFIDNLKPTCTNVKAFLLSSSRREHLKSSYLSHALVKLDFFLKECSLTSNCVLHIPWASEDYALDYEDTKGAFKSIGYETKMILDPDRCDIKKCINDIATAEVLYVSGGNTFRLLTKLYRYACLFTLIHERVCCGKLVYVGASSGAVIAGPTIMTTNDFPINLPPCLNAFGFTKYNLNVHYVHEGAGATRKESIIECISAHLISVLGMPECTMLSINGSNHVAFDEGNVVKLFDIEGTRDVRSNSIFV